MKPTLQEATLDLNNIRAELEVMRRIQIDAEWLSKRDDVDASFYQNVAMRTKHYVDKGSALEQHILKLYPELL